MPVVVVRTMTEQVLQVRIVVQALISTNVREVLEVRKVPVRMAVMGKMGKLAAIKAAHVDPNRPEHLKRSVRVNILPVVPKKTNALREALVPTAAVAVLIATLVAVLT